MNVEALGAVANSFRNSDAPDKVSQERQKNQDVPQNFATAEEQKKVQPEELLQQIKAITDDGLYSVQFENNENEELIVKIVDRESGDIIRQLPPEELLELSKRLDELTGNLVDILG